MFAAFSVRIETPVCVTALSVRCALGGEQADILTACSGSCGWKDEAPLQGLCSAWFLVVMLCVRSVWMFPGTLQLRALLFPGENVFHSPNRAWEEDLCNTSLWSGLPVPGWEKKQAHHLISLPGSPLHR